MVELHDLNQQYVALEQSKNNFKSQRKKKAYSYLKRQIPNSYFQKSTGAILGKRQSQISEEFVQEPNRIRQKFSDDISALIQSQDDDEKIQDSEVPEEDQNSVADYLNQNHDQNQIDYHEENQNQEVYLESQNLDIYQEKNDEEDLNSNSFKEQIPESFSKQFRSCSDFNSEYHQQQNSESRQVQISKSQSDLLKNNLDLNSESHQDQNSESDENLNSESDENLNSESNQDQNSQSYQDQNLGSIDQKCRKMGLVIQKNDPLLKYQQEYIALINNLRKEKSEIENSQNSEKIQKYELQYSSTRYQLRSASQKYEEQFVNKNVQLSKKIQENKVSLKINNILNQKKFCKQKAQISLANYQKREIFKDEQILNKKIEIQKKASKKEIPVLKPKDDHVLKPKKPTSPWIYFNNQKVAELKTKEGMDQKEAFPKPVEILRTMKDSDKQPYIVMSKTDEECFNQQAQELKDVGFFITKDGQKSTDLYVDPKKKYGEDFLLPRKPSSGYLFFTTEQANLIKEQEQCTHPQAMKKVGAFWYELSSEEKQKFHEMHEKDEIRYKKQIEDLDKLGYFILDDGSKSSEYKAKVKKK